MDHQQHMTKTEAHPYHRGRGCKVFDPNCPLCRDDPNRETTYISWSLHHLLTQTLRDAARAVLDSRQEYDGGDHSHVECVDTNALIALDDAVRKWGVADAVR